MGKFISAILQKNAKKRYQNYTLKSQKIRPPGNCYMGSGSATVSEGFQTGYIVVLTSVIFLHSCPLQGRKFRSIYTRKFLSFSLLYLKNATNDPQILIHRFIWHPNVGPDATL